MLNGVKQFITSGKNGDVAIVMARHRQGGRQAAASARSSCRPRRPATSSRGLEDKIGQHARDTAQIVFDNCRVPAANLIGERGRGLQDRAVGARGRAHRHRRAGGRHGARRVRGGARATRRSARASASRSSSTRRCSSGSPRWRRKIEAARQLIWHAASAEGRRPAVPEGSGDGQAVRARDGRARLLGRRSRSTAATAT